MCLAELLGPIAFAGWDANGDPIGEPRPDAWVQVAGVNKEATKNTRLMFPGLLPKKTRQKYNLDVQKEIIYVKGTSNLLEVISSSYQGAEGARPTFTLLGEIHHWTPSRGGPEFYETLRNNADKVDGAYLAITNAYMPGQDSVLERIRQAVNREREGLAVDTGWFYDSLEANPLAPVSRAWSPFILDTIRGDARWIKVENFVNSLLDTSMGISKSRRMFYNQIIAAQDALFSEGEWDFIARYGAKEDGTKTQLHLEKGDEIVLGFDGGKTDDATALVAIRIRDRMAFPIDIWQRPDGVDVWEVPVQEVVSRVNFTFRQYKVRAFFADVALWESYIADWSDQYRELLLIKASPKSAIGYDMRGNKEALTRGNEALMQAVVDGRITHNGDPLLRRHALNARRHENGVGTTFKKEHPESPNKVDAYAALLLAYIALITLSESGKRPPKEYKRRLRRSGG